MMHFPGKQIVENSNCINATIYMLPVEYPSIYSERIYLNFKLELQNIDIHVTARGQDLCNTKYCKV